MGKKEWRMGDDSSLSPLWKIQFKSSCWDDNPMKLMSIAMKPLCLPPFPLERVEEMTKLMAGDGCMER